MSLDLDADYLESRIVPEEILNKTEGIKADLLLEKSKKKYENFYKWSLQKASKTQSPNANPKLKTKIVEYTSCYIYPGTHCIKMWLSGQKDRSKDKMSKIVKMDPGIVCFQHCGPKIFCFSLPETCPVCDEDLEKANFSLLPFRVPYPFIRASQYPCSVVIKPTTGDFLNDYYNSMDLHIGVTTSTGTIVEFDKHGLRKHRSTHWNQCLLLDQVATSWREHWDTTLWQVCKQKCWSAKTYSEDNHNCYTFVLTFLVTLAYGNLSEAARNRTLFCEKFIVPRTTAAGKYISLYRKLKEYGFYVHRNK